MEKESMWTDICLVFCEDGTAKYMVYLNPLWFCSQEPFSGFGPQFNGKFDTLEEAKSASKHLDLWLDKMLADYEGWKKDQEETA